MIKLKTNLALFLLATLSLSLPAFAAPAQNPVEDSPDMLMQTRVEKVALSWLIEKTRTIMANAKFDDHLTGDIEINESPEFVLKDISTDPKFAQIRTLFSNVFKKDIDHSTIRIRIPTLHYEVKKIEVSPKDLKVQDPNLVLSARAMISGIVINLPKGVQVDFRIPNPKTHELESYFTGFVDPLFITVPANLPPVSFDADLGVEHNASFNYHLLKTNFDDIPAYVKANGNSLIILAGAKKTTLSADNINVNPVTIRVNNLKRSLDLDSFKPLVQEKMPEIVTLVLNLMGQTLKNTLGPKILTTVFSHNNRSDLLINNEHMYTRFATGKFLQPTKDQLALQIDGDLCTAKKFTKFGESCVKHEPRPLAVRTISEEDRNAANLELQTELAQGKADVGVSVSEEYLNRVLKTTMDADMWTDNLAKHRVALGPKNAFLILNEKTQTPQLYIDTLYLGEPGFQSVVVNEKHPFRFPLRISTSIKFELKDGIPYMIMKTESLLSTEDEILHGIEEYGLESHLLPFFRKKIARLILDLSSEVEGQTAFEIALPYFKNVGLEKSTYEASEHGRVHLYFKL